MEALEGMVLAKGEKSPILMEQEGCRFGLTENGALLFCALNKPTPREKLAFESSSPFQIRYVRVQGVLFMLFKFGAMPWMDAPYDIRLSSEVDFPEPAPGEGLALNIVLVDQATNIIQHLRLIGLGERFSKDLRKEVFSDANEPLIAPVYYEKINNIYSKYSTEDLVRLASHYYKLNP